MTITNAATEMPAAVENAVAATATARGKTVRPAAVACSWCGVEVTVPAKGRIPKWCGTSCRHRAWEQQRAAASGLSAVEVVDRVVERLVTVQLPAPTPPAASTPPAAAMPTGSDWVPLLTELARQLNIGRIYRRDLPAIASAFGEAQQAFNRNLPR